MKQTPHPRVARFQRLHAILTGAADTALTPHLYASDHLRSDVGLPLMHRSDRIHGQFGSFPTDPNRN